MYALHLLLGLAVAAAAAAAGDCTDVSFSLPIWEIRDIMFTAINTSTGGNYGDIKFSAHNSATNLTAMCSAENIDIMSRDTGVARSWYNCDLPETFFQFDLSEFQVKVKASWRCESSPSSVCI